MATQTGWCVCHMTRHRIAQHMSDDVIISLYGQSVCAHIYAYNVPLHCLVTRVSESGNNNVDTANSNIAVMMILQQESNLRHQHMFLQHKQITVPQL